MKNQKVFVTTLLPGDISTEDKGHTKTANLYPEDGGELFVQVVSFGTLHPQFDALIQSGKQYIVKIEQVENAPPPFKKES
jgi:hypothetical protein